MNANKQRSCPNGQIRTPGALSSKFNGGLQHDGTNQCSNPHKLISALCATSFVRSKRWKMLDYQSNTCAHSAFIRGYLADYLCTSIYFHSTFVPNTLDSSSWTRYPIQKYHQVLHVKVILIGKINLLIEIKPKVILYLNEWKRHKRCAI
jgi:hypothetical protein